MTKLCPLQDCSTLFEYLFTQFGQMFDRIDVTKQGVVNWDKFASHMLLEFYEKDDKVKSTQVPHWTELKVLST